MLDLKNHRINRAFALIWLALAMAIGIPKWGVAQTVTKFTPGLATIGDLDSSDGDSSSGVFNVAEGVEPASVLASAIHHSTRIHFLKGTYKFGTPWVTGRSNVMITGDPGAILTTTAGNATTDGSIFKFSGERITIRDLEFNVSTFVNSASVVRFVGAKDVLIDACRLVMSTTPIAVSPYLPGPVANPAFSVVSVVGSTSTPMKMLSFKDTIHKRVINNVILPNWAWTCVYSEDGSGLQFRGNYIGNNVDGGLGGGVGDLEVYLATPRLCYRVIDAIGEEWSHISSNRFWALGDYAGLSYDTNGSAGSTEAAPMDVGIQMTVGDDNSQIENGHNMIDGNIIELCPTANGMIRLWGGSGSYIVNNMIGFNGNTPNELGEAAIVIDDSNGAAASGRQNLGSEIRYNNLHNLAAADTAGAFIFARQAVNLVIQANALGVVACDYPIQIESATCENPTVIGNHFSALSAQSPLSPVHLLSGGAITGGVTVGWNSYVGFDNAACVVNDSGGSTNYFLHGLINAQTADPWTPYVLAGNTTVAAADTDTLTSTAAFGGLAVGDAIVINGFTGAGAVTNNGPIRYVTVFTSTSSIDVSGPALTADAAGEAVTIVKIPTAISTNVDMD